MQFDIIVQARIKSSRLPSKIFLNFEKSSFIDFFSKNLKKTKNIRKIIIAAPDDEFKSIFISFCKKLNLELFLFKGHSENVLKRYYMCAKKYSSKNIIRITSDCPFINPEIINYMTRYYKNNDLSFLTNNSPRFIPHGFDCEIIKFSLLKECFLKAKKKYDLEHVTPWIYKNYFSEKNNIKILKKNFSNIRITLDTPTDYINFLKNKKILIKVATEKNYLNYLKKLI